MYKRVQAGREHRREGAAGAGGWLGQLAGRMRCPDWARLGLHTTEQALWLGLAGPRRGGGEAAGPMRMLPTLCQQGVAARPVPAQLAVTQSRRQSGPAQSPAWGP